MPAFFVLQPGSWPDSGTHLCRPLLGTRQQHKPQIPWVSVARGEPYGDVEIVRREGLDGDRARALIAEAGAWADGCRRKWDVVAQSGILWWKKPSMLRPIVLGGSMGLRRDPMDDLS